MINYPGFNDYRPSVNSATDDYLNHTDAFLLVVDLNRGVTQTDIEIYKKLDDRKRPLLVCANKMDLVRPADRAALLAAVRDRLGISRDKCVECSFDPDPRLKEGTRGRDEVRAWLRNIASEAGKNLDALS